MRERGRYPKSLPALLVLAVVAVQFRGVLGGGVWRFEDIAGYFAPIWTAVARSLRAGRLPLWDPGAWSGQPLIGDPQAGVFYPPNWLALLLPALRAYAVVVVAHAAFAGLGMYVLVRVRGRSRAAAALAGISLGAGAYVVMQARHAMFVEATAWIPWLVAAGWSWIETGRRLWLAATAAATGMLLLTGGVSMILYGSWFVAAVLLARVAEEAPGDRLRALGGLAVAALLGAGLAAPMLLPMIEHAGLSPRALGADYAFASSFAWKHYGYAVTLLLPNPFGDHAAGTWRGGGTQWELAGYYAGALPFLLALYWIARGDGRRGERVALALLAVIAVGLAREGSLLSRAAHHLPLLGATRCPARALYLLSLVVPLLAADGLDALLARLPRNWQGLVAGIALAVVAADLLVAHRRWNPAIPLARAEAAARLDATAFLAARGERYVNDVHLDHALHNSGLLWGLENASGYHSLPIWRYLHLLWIANHGAPYPHARIHDDLSAQGLWRFSSPIVDLLAVRWVLAKEPPGPGFVRRFTGGDGVDVYENREALPRAFVVHRARVVDGPGGSARAVAALDPRREVVLEEAPSPAPQGDGFAAAESFTRRSPTEIEVRARLDRAGILVVSEPAYPGWRATVDGAPAPILVADHALRAVALPAGRHVVTMRYEAPAATNGLLIAACALAMILALAVTRR